MIAAQDFKQGQFTYTPANGAQEIVPIDFNPASLDYSVSIKARGEGGQTQQAAGAASATLTMELLFDTTDSGEDVTASTRRLQAFGRCLQRGPIPDLSFRDRARPMCQTVRQSPTASGWAA